MENLDQTYKRLLSENKKEEICKGCDQPVSKCTCSTVKEDLKGGQKNLDKNHNGKLDGQDFAILRNKKKKVVSETAEEPPFDKPYKTTKGVVTDKSGAKHGPMSRARDLARSALNKHLNATYDEYNPEKDKLKKQHFGMAEEVQIDEANHREFASQGKMHPDMAKHMTVGSHMDYYEPKTGDKVHGKVMHKSDTEVHMKQTHDSYDPKKKGSVHKFSVSSKLDEQIDEVLKPSMGAAAYIDDFIKSKNPKFAGKSSEKRRQMALAAYYAAKKGVKEEVETIDELNKTTLRSYRSKAANDRRDTRDDIKATRMSAREDDAYRQNKNGERDAVNKDISQMTNRVHKRSAGISSASSRIHKEEIQVDEANVQLNSQKTKDSWHAKFPDANHKEKDLINRGLGHIVHNQRNPNAPQMKSTPPKKPMSEETAGESYEDALGHLEKANAAKEGSQGYHYHMSNHHEAMGHWHASKGRNLSAEKEFNKAEAHHDLGVDLKEEIELEESEQKATPTVKTNKYSWGTMKTIHHGSSFSIPLHPEHHEHIAQMKDQQQHTIKTEDGRQYHVKREGDTVHFHGVNGGNKTSVPHKSLAEETQVDEAWVLRQKKKEKKPVKEENMISFKDFITEMEFDKNGKYVHKGKYGTSYDDPEGKEDSEKPSAEKAEKRGRGRPAGAKSGARQIGGASKKGSGVEYTGYKLHLPNSNK